MCSLVRTEFNKKYFDVLESLLVANNIQYFTNTYLKKHSLHIVTIYLTIAITIGSMSTFFNTIYNEFSSVRCEHLRIFLLLFCIIWVYIPCNTFNMSRLTLVKIRVYNSIDPYNNYGIQKLSHLEITSKHHHLNGVAI